MMQPNIHIGNAHDDTNDTLRQCTRNMIINHASLDYQFCQNNDMHNITTKLRMESKLKPVIFKGSLELEDVLKKKKGELGRVTKMLHESPDL